MTWPQPDGRLRSQHRHEEQSKIEAMFLKTGRISSWGQSLG